MKTSKLLELIKYIKEKDLIRKYNEVYKKYDENKGIDNPGFKLQDLYSLNDECVNLILSSKHDVEALFKLRMNSVNYNELINYEVKTNDNIVLEIIENIRSKEDYDEYDKDKKIIRLVIRQKEQGIEKFKFFMNYMDNKKEMSTCGLSMQRLHNYLYYVCESKTYNGAKLISMLASSSKERNDYGFHKYMKNEDYVLNVIDKISKCEKDFQVEYIDILMRMQEYNPVYNAILLNNIPDNYKKLKVIELFTKTENEDACKRMIEIIKESIDNLINRSDYVISMLEECSTLRNDEDYVNISSITEIDDLEEILNTMDKDAKINGFVKVKVKKRKRQ